MQVAHFLRSLFRLYTLNPVVSQGKGSLIQKHFLKLERRITSNQTVLHTIDNDITMELELLSYVDRYVFYCDFYRPWIKPFFRHLLSPGQIVFDIGANIGVFSLLAAKCIGPKGQLYAFEPEPLVFKQLQTNIALNDFHGVTAYNKAISNSQGTIQLHTSHQNSNLGRASLRAMSFHDSTIDIPCDRLDSAYKKLNLDCIDLVKLDTQGAEYMVLQGAQAVAEKYHPTFICRLHEDKLALFGHDIASVFDWFRELDYDVYTLWDYRTNKPAVGEYEVASQHIGYRLTAQVPPFDQINIVAIRGKRLPH